MARNMSLVHTKNGVLSPIVCDKCAEFNGTVISHVDFLTANTYRGCVSKACYARNPNDFFALHIRNMMRPDITQESRYGKVLGHNCSFLPQMFRILVTMGVLRLVCYGYNFFNSKVWHLVQSTVVGFFRDFKCSHFDNF